MRDIPIQMVYLGTCTGGRVRDFHQALAAFSSNKEKHHVSGGRTQNRQSDPGGRQARSFRGEENDQKVEADCQRNSRRIDEGNQQDAPGSEGYEELRDSFEQSLL